MSKHIIVVGGGVMGCAVAWRLAEAGRDVVVLERAVPGAEASSAAAGILGAQVESRGPGPLLDLSLASRDAWPAFAAALRDRTGVDVGWRECGALEIGLTAREMAGLRERCDWMRAAGLNADLLTGADLHKVELGLSDNIAGALLLADDHQVEPKLLARALAAAAHAAGAHFRRAQYVRQIHVANGRVTGVSTQNERLEADTVVVAAGAWTSLLPGLAAARAEIVPQHGQLLMLETRPPLLRRVLVYGRIYVVPRADGRVIVGATAEDRGFHKTVTAGGVAELLSAALALVPALSAATFVKTWAGLRPQSLDGLPMLGEHRSVRGLHLAAGHHRNGILLAPISAQIVAGAILGEPAPLPVGPFAP